MTHRSATALMVLVTVLWSIAGIVTRNLETARSFEVTFWRSLFTVLALIIALSVLRGAALWRSLRTASLAVWISGICWSVQFTAFMMALTLTTVANVLVPTALGPLITAFFARIFLHHRLPVQTWVAISIAGMGIGWMFGYDAVAGISFIGTLVALAVPLAAAVNWTILQHKAHSDGDSGSATAQDMFPAVLIGALISAAATLLPALPLQASIRDIGLLALLGFVQLALPCLLVVRVSRLLPAPEIALIGLLEVVFGVAWVWLGAGERPSVSTIIGGVLVLGALVVNETLEQRRMHENTQ